VPTHPYVFSFEAVNSSPAQSSAEAEAFEEREGKDDPLGFIVANGLQSALDYARGFDQLWASNQPTEAKETLV
jgi:hypothetical protein